MTGGERPLLAGAFWFLRHGESETNARGLIAGSTDAPLTARGRTQAEQAAALLRGVGLRLIVASPLARAAATARIVADALDLPVRFVGDLRERDWGVLENRPLAERGDRFATPAGGESWAGFGDRIWAALAGLRVPVPTLVVAHSGTLRVVRDRLCGGDEAASAANALPLLVAPDAGRGRWRTIPVHDVTDPSKN